MNGVRAVRKAQERSHVSPEPWSLANIKQPRIATTHSHVHQPRCRGDNLDQRPQPKNSPDLNHATHSPPPAPQAVVSSTQHGWGLYGLLLTCPYAKTCSEPSMHSVTHPSYRPCRALTRGSLDVPQAKHARPVCDTPPATANTPRVDPHPLPHHPSNSVSPAPSELRVGG